MFSIFGCWTRRARKIGTANPVRFLFFRCKWTHSLRMCVFRRNISHFELRDGQSLRMCVFRRCIRISNFELRNAGTQCVVCISACFRKIMFEIWPFPADAGSATNHTEAVISIPSFFLCRSSTPTRTGTTASASLSLGKATMSAPVATSRPLTTSCCMT